MSMPHAFAYVANEALPDTPLGQDPGDAAYQTAHGYPGGIVALAARMGVSAGTLTHKVNPANTTHHLSLREAVDLQFFSGNAAVLHAMAARLGYTCTRAMPDQAGGDPVEALVRQQIAHADFTRQYGDAVLRLQEGRPPSTNDMRRCAEYAGDAMAAINDALAALRGKLPAAPEVPR